MKHTKNMQKTICGWAVNVFFGDRRNNPADVRRYTYKTRKQAQSADISDAIGKNGRTA